MTQPRDDKGRYASKFGLIFAAGALGVVAAVGVGPGASGVGASAEGVASADTPTLSVQARTVKGKQRTGRAQRSLATRGLRGELRAQADSGSCAADARGQVREFLATHPCRSVYRALFEVRQDNTAALVAVAWVEMVDVRDATALKTLVDQPGTGNVNQLPPPPGQRVVDLIEPAYASHQDGRLVVTVEAEPVAVTAQQKALEAIAKQAAASAAA